jgi:hypothetical protein
MNWVSDAEEREGIRIIREELCMLLYYAMFRYAMLGYISAMLVSKRIEFQTQAMLPRPAKIPANAS